MLFFYKNIFYYNNTFFYNFFFKNIFIFFLSSYFFFFKLYILLFTIFLYGCFFNLKNNSVLFSIHYVLIFFFLNILNRDFFMEIESEFFFWVDTPTFVNIYLNEGMFLFFSNNNQPLNLHNYYFDFLQKNFDFFFDSLDLETSDKNFFLPNDFVFFSFWENFFSFFSFSVDNDVYHFFSKKSHMTSSILLTFFILIFKNFFKNFFKICI